ncbi:MAG TPA: hypothetical protein VGX28_09220 [Frankiaceae bacterium]|jgi:hypothetical protein|nr:hypothetical protein [Frankiaceae bacterium]
MRKLLALSVLAASLATPTAAFAVKDCEEQGPCLCGQEIAVGLPDKDPIVSLGRIDC